MNIGGVTAYTKYLAECYGPDGNLKWKDEGHNLVTTEGANHALDATFKTGVTTPAWYIGLKGSGAVATGDTLASHAGWSEVTPYAGSRPVFTGAAPSSGTITNTATKASYTINAGATVYGAFSCTATTGTSGTLYGAGDFSGARTVGSGDTLNVTVNKTLAGS